MRTPILDHIGIAVKERENLEKLLKLIGLQVTHRESVVDQGVHTHFLPLPAAEGHLELLEVTDPQGTVAKFIEKRGPGVHHLAFRLSAGELGPLIDRLRAEGIRLVYEAPRRGAQKMWVNFVHPASAGGLLIELMEPQE